MGTDYSSLRRLAVSSRRPRYQQTGLSPIRKQSTWTYCRRLGLWQVRRTVPAAARARRRAGCFVVGGCAPTAARGQAQALFSLGFGSSSFPIPDIRAKLGILCALPAYRRSWGARPRTNLGELLPCARNAARGARSQPSKESVSGPVYRLAKPANPPALFSSSTALCLAACPGHRQSRFQSFAGPKITALLSVARDTAKWYRGSFSQDCHVNVSLPVPSLLECSSRRGVRATNWLLRNISNTTVNTPFVNFTVLTFGAKTPGWT